MNLKTKKNETLDSRLSTKYRLTDIVLSDKKRRTIQQLIDRSPLYLWNMIHSKHSNFSLVRNAYAMLKARVRAMRPDLVERAEKDYQQHKTKKMLRKALKEGTAGLPCSRFKKIASRKVVE
jgi:hypothetical protein